MQLSNLYYLDVYGLTAHTAPFVSLVLLVPEQKKKRKNPKNFAIVWGTYQTLSNLCFLSISLVPLKKGRHDTQHNGPSYDTQHNNIECHYAECRDYLNVMLSVIKLNVVMLNVVAPKRLSMDIPERDTAQRRACHFAEV